MTTHETCRWLALLRHALPLDQPTRGELLTSMDYLCDLAETARQQGLLSLDDRQGRDQEPAILRAHLDMMVDGSDRNVIESSAEALFLHAIKDRNLVQQYLCLLVLVWVDGWNRRWGYGPMRASLSSALGYPSTTGDPSGNSPQPRLPHPNLSVKHLLAVRRSWELDDPVADEVVLNSPPHTLSFVLSQFSHHAVALYLIRLDRMPFLTVLSALGGGASDAVLGELRSLGLNDVSGQEDLRQQITKALRSFLSEGEDAYGF